MGRSSCARTHGPHPQPTDHSNDRLIRNMQSSISSCSVCRDDKTEEVYSGLMRHEFQSEYLQTINGQRYKVATYHQHQHQAIDPRLKQWAQAASSGACLDEFSVLSTQPPSGKLPLHS